VTEPELRIELGRAYRALGGLYRKVRSGVAPDPTMLAYHSPTIAAACRFTTTGEIGEGSAFFIGKPVEELHNALRD